MKLYEGMEVLISDAHSARFAYDFVVGKKGTVVALFGSWPTAYQVAIPSDWGDTPIWEIDAVDCLPFAPSSNEDALHLLKKQLGGNEDESNI
jgi:hypothetical protein